MSIALSSFSYASLLPLIAFFPVPAPSPFRPFLHSSLLFLSLPSLFSSLPFHSLPCSLRRFSPLLPQLPATLQLPLSFSFFPYFLSTSLRLLPSLATIPCASPNPHFPPLFLPPLPISFSTRLSCSFPTHLPVLHSTCLFSLFSVFRFLTVSPLGQDGRWLQSEVLEEK